MGCSSSRNEKPRFALFRKPDSRAAATATLISKKSTQTKALLASDVEKACVIVENATVQPIIHAATERSSMVSASMIIALETPTKATAVTESSSDTLLPTQTEPESSVENVIPSVPESLIDTDPTTQPQDDVKTMIDFWKKREALEICPNLAIQTAPKYKLNNSKFVQTEMHFPEIPAQTEPVCIFASDATFSSHSLDEIDYIPSLDLLGNLLFADFPFQQLDDIEMMEFIYTPSTKQNTQVGNSVLPDTLTNIEQDALLASIRELKALIHSNAINNANLFKSYPNINQKHKDDVTDISSKMKGTVFLIEQKLEMSRSHSEGFEVKSTQAEESAANILETKIDITTEGAVVADLETVVASQNQQLICAIAGKSEPEDDVDWDIDEWDNEDDSECHLYTNYLDKQKNTAVLVSDIDFELGVPQAFGKEALYQRIGKNVDTLDDAVIDSFVASEPMVENAIKLLRNGDGLEIKLDDMKELLQKALIYFLNFFDIQDNFLDCELDLDALIKKRNKRRLRKMETLTNF